MKRLILLRHGKSDWGADYGSDHERPLAKRGTAAATDMGRVLAAVGEAPDEVVTSSAVRARSTAALTVEAAGWPLEPHISDALYGASPAEVVDVIRARARDEERLMLVGHEPTWSDLTELLTGAVVRVATATAVGIDLEVATWSQVAPGSGHIVYVLPPRLVGKLVGE